MGRQANFYMTRDDEREFVEFIRATGNIMILSAVQHSSEPVGLDELPPVGEPFWFALCLWNKDISPCPLLAYVKEQRYYCVDEFKSDVVQFHRCGMDEGRLVRGRIWAEMDYWRYKDPPVLVKKSDAFSKWYDRLAQWIKRHSTRDQCGFYVMPGAAEYAKKGGPLVQAVFAKTVKLVHHEVQEPDPHHRQP